MNEILKEKIYNYLANDNAKYAFLVSGAWGSGKTYFFKNSLFPEMRKKENGRIPIMISLFGVNEVNSIPYLLLNAYIREMNSNGESARESMKKGLDFIDQKYGLGGRIPNMDFHDAEEIVFKIIPHDKVFICFDDFERFGQNGNVIELLGFINNLCENLDFKVVIITNEQKERKEGQYTNEDKEKAIGEACIYIPSLYDVYDNIIKEETPSDFTIFLQREDIKGLVFPHSHLSKSLNDFINIRNFLSVISTFKTVFDFYEGAKDNVTQQKLRLYLAFTVAAVIEFRNGNLSFYDKHTLDTFTEVARLELDLGDDIESDVVRKMGKDNEDDEEKKKIEEKKHDDYKYARDFYEKYFKCLNLKYVFIEPIYNNITGGVPFNKEDLDKSIEGQIDFYPVVNKGNDIVEIMLKGVWQYTDEEFKTALTDLLGYVERGELTDYVNYINATIFLQGYISVLGIDSSLLRKKITDGLLKYSQQSKITPLDHSRILAISYQIDEEFKWVIDSISSLLKNQTEEESKSYLAVLNDEFIHNLSSLAERFNTSKGEKPYYYFNSPILHQLDRTLISGKMQELIPKDVMSLYYLINNRYVEDGRASLAVELPFLEAIKEGLHKRNSKTASLTQILINRFLLPTVEKAIKRLNKN